MTESCVLIGRWQKFNTQTKILPQVLWSNNFKWCPTNDPRADVQRANLVASIKNGIKHFLFSTTATIAQKSLLIHLICILLTNLTVPCLHSSRKIQSPKTFFYTHKYCIKITFVRVWLINLTLVSFYMCPGDLCTWLIHKNNLTLRCLL